MAAGTANLKCDQGATFDIIVTWKDANDSAVDITNYNGRMDVRFAQSKSSDLVIALTSANGRIVKQSALEGKFQLKISAADTAELNAGTYYYDFEAFTSDATDPVEVTRLIQGTFTVNAEVTG